MKPVKILLALLGYIGFIFAVFSILPAFAQDTQSFDGSYLPPALERDIARTKALMLKYLPNPGCKIITVHCTCSDNNNNLLDFTAPSIEIGDPSGKLVCTTINNINNTSLADPTSICLITINGMTPEQAESSGLSCLIDWGCLEKCNAPR